MRNPNKAANTAPIITAMINLGAIGSASAIIFEK